MRVKKKATAPPNQQKRRVAAVRKRATKKDDKSPEPAGEKKRPGPKANKKQGIALKTTKSRKTVKERKDNSDANLAESEKKNAVVEDSSKQPKEKTKAINKVLKSLDVKINTFDKNLPPEEKIIVDLKSSISENVKTKSRASAAKPTAAATATASGSKCAKKESAEKDDGKSAKKDTVDKEECKAKDNAVEHKQEVITSEKVEDVEAAQSVNLANESSTVKAKAKIKPGRKKKEDVEKKPTNPKPQKNIQKRTLGKAKKCVEQTAQQNKTDLEEKSEQTKDKLPECKKDNEIITETTPVASQEEILDSKVNADTKPLATSSIEVTNTSSKDKPDKPEETTKKIAFMTARQRLQTKFDISKTAKQHKLPISVSKTSLSQEKNTQASKPNDVYDFKSGSESEDNIKMELPTLKKLKNSSDEDDKPLKARKDKPKSDTEKKTQTPVKVPKKDEKAKPTKAAQKKVTIKPKVESTVETESSSSSDSEEEIYVGPKRHRMASLNALAKVQCLYENESRTAHELGLSKTIQMPKMRTLNSSSGSEEEKEVEKKKSGIKSEPVVKKEKEKEKETKKVEEEALKIEPAEESKEEEDSKEEEVETKRELRNAPGVRGVGMLWDFHDNSSYESANESDSDEKKNVRKRKLQRMKLAAKKEKEKEKMKKPVARPPRKKKVKIQESDNEGNSDSNASSDNEKKPGTTKGESKAKSKPQAKKRKKPKDDFLADCKGILARKRIASLNASAIVAATYEVERHLDRNLASDCSSYESLSEEVKRPYTKKTKEIKPDPADEEKCAKDKESSSRPTSSSVVIVQDTDVTITGVYVNPATGSSQEAYCKMQYRVQSSVTEERVMTRPGSTDPPKSYTPLGALSSMRPPGAAAAAAAAAAGAPANCDVPPTSEPPLLHANPYPHPVSINPDPPPPYHYPPHHPGGTVPPHHPHPGDHSTPIHHYSHPPVAHHYHQPAPIQPTPMQQTCESMHYPPGSYQPQSGMPLSTGVSSAFCAPSMQQSHHDLTGYYQPAGPLISPHILPPGPAPSSNVPIVPVSSAGSKKQIPTPLNSDPDQLQQPPLSTSTAESSDSDVLITGADLSTFRYPSSTSSQHQPHSQASAHLHQPPQPQPQNSHYSRSMHQMHYPPSYPSNYYTPYPGEAMCYSPSYQPYFPAKVYQSSPAYRRFPSYYPPGQPPPPTSDLYDASQQGSAPPPTGSQLVPAVPTPHSQHLEHYPAPPGYYTGYSPGGAQCYSRGMQPAYMEYPPPCPCPMQQSCPKNALTGPLIGSNSSNAVNSSNTTNTINSTTNINNNNSSSNSHNPIILPTMNISNNLLDMSAPKSSSTIANSSSSISTSSSLNSNLNNQPLNTVRGPVKNATQSDDKHRHHHVMHPCKMEPMEPFKRELKVEEENDIKSSQYEENVVPPTPPISYTVNEKLLEPEMTLSPARGSTGLPTLPESNEVTAPVVVEQATTIIKTSETTHDTGLTNLSVIGRKARIGKTMAREMMYGSMHNHHHPHPHHFSVAPQSNPDMFPNPVSFALTSQRTNLTVTQPEVKDTSQNSSPFRLKAEIKTEDIKSEKEEEDIVVILDDDKELKKIKTEAVEPDVVEVFDDANKVDDSASIEVQGTTEMPSNVEEEDVVGPTPAKRMKILEFGKGHSKKSSPTNSYKSLIKQTDTKSYLCLSRKADKKDRFGNISKSKATIRKRKLVLTDQQKKRLKQRKKKLIALAKHQNEREAKEEEQQQDAPSVGLKETEGKDLSSLAEIETSKQTPLSALDATIDMVARGYFSEPEIRTTSSNSASGRTAKKSKAAESRSKSETKKSAKSSTSTEAQTSSSITGMEPLGKKKGRKPKIKKDVDILSDTPLQPQAELDLGNNNNILETNNNEKPISAVEPALAQVDELPLSDDVLFRQPAIPKPHPAKRARSRIRFGGRKRHKNRFSIANEVDDTILLRKSNVSPKWNNGWVWEGEPFQGKVFLNSDEPLVIRKCYPAMRHSEGDIIRPRDSILLRAGAKKNELPYVAKVAHLWENPEDGEMMVSLLWYYRPEHTEQGRQPVDAADEVFASKHRDHNSVACIEDKCYVLTFNEYCRHRRDIRAAEEGVETQCSIVPKLPNLENRRKVPLTTNPELVLFCQRIYEFRLKRLMKMPNT